MGAGRPRGGEPRRRAGILGPPAPRGAVLPFPAAPHSGRSPMKPRALVLDDEPLMRDFLTETLRGSGFEVAAHAEPASALEGWVAFGPDVVFLDLRLPGTSGVEVLRE